MGAGRHIASAKTCQRATKRGKRLSLESRVSRFVIRAFLRHNSRSPEAVRHKIDSALSLIWPSSGRGGRCVRFSQNLYLISRAKYPTKSNKGDKSFSPLAWGR